MASRMRANPRRDAQVWVTAWTRMRPPKEPTPVAMGSLHGAAVLGGCGVRLSG